VIRGARGEDAAAIAAIWTDVITGSTATFTTVPKTAGAVTDALAAQPFFVSETAGAVSGFATYGAFRAGPGYARTAEHSIHIAPAARGRGEGRALMAALEAHARGRTIHSMIAGLSAENAAGRGFHAALGYREVARIPQAGWKFGRWHDLVLMQKFL
jgi:phosphinothricin acetyltransferase